MFGLKSASLFGDTKKLEREIDEFVDIVSEVGLVFKSIVPTYLNHSANGKFEEMVEKVKEMESKADKITKDVEHTLYEETLIPDARSDVLRLLEHIDELIGMYQGLSLIHISEPTRQAEISYAVFCLITNTINLLYKISKMHFLI